MMKDYAIRFLGKYVSIRIDRSLGIKHPRHGFIYPLNYGYIPNTKAPDGSEVDAYVLGVFEPVKIFRGKCIAVIHRTNDEDDKLIVVPNGVSYTNAYIKVF